MQRRIVEHAAGKDMDGLAGLHVLRKDGGGYSIFSCFQTGTRAVMI